MKKEKKKIERKKGFISAETYHKIYEMYWDENVEQPLLSEIFNVAQGHVSRIVNGKALPHQRTLFNKKLEMERRIIPSAKEAIQAKILRSRREQLHSTKLTWKKVEKIRKDYFDGSIGQMALAKKFGINQSTLNQIVRGIKWKLNK